MGQYHIILNNTRKEWLRPSAFGDGTKLREFGCSMGGTMTGLTLLLAGSNTGGARGGGDFGAPEGHEDMCKVLVGRWAGDRISIIGDYAQKGDINRVRASKGLYSNTVSGEDGWADISEHVILLLEAMGEIAEDRGYSAITPRSTYCVAADTFVPLWKDR